MKRIAKIATGIGAGVLTAVVPLTAGAVHRDGHDQDVGGFLDQVLGWIDTLILIVMALAFLFFLWGLAKFVLNAGDETSRSEGKQTMLWGIIAFVVMVSLWGIVGVLSESLGVDLDDDEAQDTFRQESFRDELRDRND